MKYVEAAEAAHFRSLLVQSSQSFKTAWVNAGRIVVPGEEVRDLSSDPDGVRLIEAFRSAGYQELLCLTTDDLGPDEPNQAVIAPLEEADDWRWSVAPFDAVLATPDLSAAVLLSVDEFILVGGEPSFIETALGKLIPAAKGAFKAYASNTSNASRHLPALAEQYGC